MRFSDYLPYVALTTATLFFVHAVVAQHWSTRMKYIFRAVMALTFFACVGVYWLATGEKPDETAYRVILCPILALEGCHDKGINPPAPQLAERPTNPADESAWKKAEEEQLIISWSDYLASFPSGVHAAEAKSRIRARESSDRRVRSFNGHSNSSIAVAISPDGKLVLSGGGNEGSINPDFSMKLWSIATGEELHSFIGHTSTVLSIAFTRDGEQAVSGGGDKAVRIWDLSSRQLVQTLRGHTAPVASVAASPRGLYAISAGYDKMTRIWAVYAGHEIGTLAGHEDIVWNTTFSSDEQFVVSASGDQTIRIWDFSRKRELRRLHGHADGVTCVEISPDWRYIVSGSYDRTVRLWDFATGSLVRTMTGHNSVVTSAVFVPRTPYILTASNDNTMRVWHRETGKTVRIFPAPTINRVAVSASGQLAVSSSMDGPLTVWDLTGIE